MLKTRWSGDGFVWTTNLSGWRFELSGKFGFLEFGLHDEMKIGLQLGLDGSRSITLRKV
jgi:hypothetical protein